MLVNENASAKRLTALFPRNARAYSHDEMLAALGEAESAVPPDQLEQWIENALPNATGAVKWMLERWLEVRSRRAEAASGNGDRVLLKNEAKFFSKAKASDPRTQAVLQRIRALHSPPEVGVEFGDTQDGTMRVYVRGASATAALVTFEGTGRLMLMLQYQHGKAAEGLLALGRELGWTPPPDWRNRKPTFCAGTWEHKVDAIVRLVQSL